MTIKKLKKKIDIFPGHKTYLIIFIAIIVNALYMTQFISEQFMTVINTFLGFLGLGTIALKIDRKNDLEIKEHNK